MRKLRPSKSGGPASIGQRFGPLFATYWFRATAHIPEAWRDQRVDLIWASQSEATLWIDGESRQGLNCGNSSFGNADAVREDAVLLRRAIGGQLFRFQIEMACNRLGGYGSEIEMPSLLKVNSPYVLERAEIALFDPEAWDLFHDYRVLQELEAEQAHALDKAWGGLLLAELNRFANLYEADDRKTWAPAREILSTLHRNRNGGTVHELSAIGHAHIDTAWLWPLAETARKCERSFSTAVSYMDEYPEYKFACSQGYQYDVIRRKNPGLYRRIREKISSGQWIPVGGSWIEPDCNLPSGESLCRQFIHGQRFFRREFGLTCREFWNPDVFGYNGQLPQIMRLAGITRFLTQKLSWNQFTKPLHHTFIWEGIDGSEVFTHFPPLDSYNAEARIRDLRRSAENYKDHDRSRRSIMLYGYGDGGGGPSREMLETIRRAADLQGVPRTRQQSSADFFQALEEDNTDRARQVGELYLEYHRGTYTTQAAAKKGNRRNEILLHEAEFLGVAATLTQECPIPASTLDRLWKILLLHQFHDILPGSSIREVYEDTARAHSLISRKAESLIDKAGAILAGEGDDVTVINTTGFERSEVVTLENGSLAFATSPPYGIGHLAPAGDRVVVTESADGITLENQYLRATLARSGSLTSLIHKPTNREALAAPANLFELYPDNPTNWDAWDIDPFHLEKMNPCPPADSCALAEARDLRAGISFARRIGAKSTLRQTVRMSSHSQTLEFHTEVDWKETHQLLKVAFPVSVRAMTATYEMQFGVVERPTHFNTLRDLAQYEVPHTDGAICRNPVSGSLS
jgi:alpha-mannosidase